MTPTVPRMDPEQSRAWLALVSTAQLLPTALDRQLTRDAGLINFEYAMLSMLNVAADQTLRLGDLAQAVDSPYPRASKAVSRLETRGLVERLPCPEDGRAINVRLTRAGRQAWLRATPPHVALAKDELLADFTPAQLTVLAELLEVVVRRLDPEHRLGDALSARSDTVAPPRSTRAPNP